MGKRCHFVDQNELFCVFKAVFYWVSREDYVKYWQGTVTVWGLGLDVLVLKVMV